MGWLKKKLETGEPFTCKDIYDKLGLKFVMGVAVNGDKAIAGPMAVASVILPVDHKIKNIKPYYHLSSQEADKVYKDIHKNCLSLHFGWASPSIIYKAGKHAALEAAFSTAMGSVNRYDPASVIITDGYQFDILFANMEAEGIPIISYKGASNSLDTVMAASIAAKAVREQVMVQLCHNKYPEYGWDTNFGYATKKHSEAIKEHGITPFHRDLSNVKSIQDTMLFANIRK